MELFEDGDGEGEAVLHLREKQKGAVSNQEVVHCKQEVMHESVRSYQVCDEFCQKLGTLLHLVLGPSQLHNVTLLSRVGEIDHDLKESVQKKSDFKLEWEVILLIS